MNTCIAPLLLAGLLLPAGFARAQGGAPVKVTTTLHSDGSRTDRQLNPDERTATETTYDAAEKQVQKIVYKLDDAGDATEGVVYDPKGQAVMKLNFTVDPATRRVTERQELTPAGVLIRKLVYQYGPNGKVSKVEAFDRNGNPIASRR